MVKGRTRCKMPPVEVRRAGLQERSRKTKQTNLRRQDLLNSPAAQQTPKTYRLRCKRAMTPTREQSNKQTKSEATPLSHLVPVSQDDCLTTEEEKGDMASVPYASLIGPLMYAIIGTQPDIVFAVGDGDQDRCPLNTQTTTSYILEPTRNVRAISRATRMQRKTNEMERKCKTTGCMGWKARPMLGLTRIYLQQ